MGNRGEKLSPLKLAVVQYGILLMMLALTAGLWRLQVLGADNYRLLAEQNRVRKEPVLAPRGKLFDRENRLVVDNYPSVSCFLVREQNRNVDNDLPLIARGLDLDVEQLRATLRRYRAAPGYQPIPIKLDVTPDEEAFIEAHRNELPELETIDEERRLYPNDGFAAHLIGYVGEVSEEDLNNPRFAYNNPGDVVGKAGVEETYDELLRGQDGSRDVIVDSHGREVGYLGIQHAIPGQDLRLTIDNDLQRAAELALGDRNGAIVAMDPRNGEILAMVSRPSFDPNEFAVRINRADWNQLITDPDHPLMNKSIQAQRAAGRRRAEHEDHLLGGMGTLRLFSPLRRTSRRSRYSQCHSLLLRHLLLHAGRQAGHRQNRKVCHCLRLRPEDRHRSARRTGRPHALRAVEDEELPQPLVSRRNS
jgi:penicillin-binding protein 2